MMKRLRASTISSIANCWPASMTTKSTKAWRRSGRIAKITWPHWPRRSQVEATMSSFSNPHYLYLFEMKNGKKKLAYGQSPEDALEILRLRLTEDEMAQII